MSGQGPALSWPTPLTRRYAAAFEAYGPGYPGSRKGERWEHFQAGAREVWEAVKPLLVE